MAETPSLAVAVLRGKLRSAVGDFLAVTAGPRPVEPVNEAAAVLFEEFARLLAIVNDETERLGLELHYIAQLPAAVEAIRSAMIESRETQKALLQ